MKPKANRYAVIIPGKLTTNNNRRAEIGFPRSEPSGVDTRFASYLHQEFQTVVGKWKNVNQTKKKKLGPAEVVMPGIIFQKMAEEE